MTLLDGDMLKCECGDSEFIAFNTTSWTVDSTTCFVVCTYVYRNETKEQMQYEVAKRIKMRENILFLK